MKMEVMTKVEKAEKLVCENCNQVHDKCESIETLEGTMLCTKCYQNHQCSICGEYEPEPPSTPDGQVYCMVCFEDRFFTCDICFDVFEADEMHVNDCGNIYCASCWDEVCQDECDSLEVDEETEIHTT
jgi:hypothetical protein